MGISVEELRQERTLLVASHAPERLDRLASGRLALTQTTSPAR